jgi:hypothetical protein
MTTPVGSSCSSSSDPVPSPGPPRCPCPTCKASCSRPGFDPLHGIRDLDIVYHHPLDLSTEAEERLADRVTTALGGVLHGAGIEPEVRNQARVHLWYEARFGRRIAPHPSLEAAVATWPATATCVAVRLRAGRLDACAPFGLADLLSLRVRPNRVLAGRDVYEAKVARWADLWPHLDVGTW